MNFENKQQRIEYADRLMQEGVSRLTKTKETIALGYYVAYLKGILEETDNVEVDNDEYVEIGKVAYLPEKLQYHFRNGQDVFDYIVSFPIVKVKEQKRANDAPQEKKANVPVAQGELISNASAINALLDGDDAQAMFIDMVRGREVWAWDDFIKCVTKIVAAQQGVERGKVGEIRPVTADELEMWKDDVSGAQHYFGPFLIQKLAHQQGARLMISGDVQRLTRDGVDVEIRGAFEFGEGDLKKFVQGLTYKGKKIGLKQISVEAYGLVDLLNRHYKIGASTTKRGKVAVTLLTPTDEEKMGLKGSALSYTNKDHVDAILKKIAKEVNEANMDMKDADLVIDAIAQLSNKYVDDKVKAVAAARRKKLKMAMESCNSVIMAAIASKDPNAANAALQTLTQHVTPAQVSSFLKTCRDGRNITSVSQYSLKNIGSLGGNISIPAVEVVLKGARIDDFLSNNEFDGIESHCMYGVAYAHMLQPLQREGVEWQLFDIQPSTKSAYQITKGDILLAKHRSALIIDDTQTHQRLDNKRIEAIKAELAITGKIENITGDEFKLQRFCQHFTSCTIITKVVLGNITQGIINTLFPSKGSMPFSYVRCFKFGKLHNLEVYLVLSNSAKKMLRGGCNRKQFEADMNACALVASVANTLIQGLHKQGIGNSSGDRKIVDGVWKHLLAANPRSWPWYKNVYGSDVEVNVDVGASDFYNVEYEDDGEESISWGDDEALESYNEEVKRFRDDLIEQGNAYMDDTVKDYYVFTTVGGKMTPMWLDQVFPHMSVVPKSHFGGKKPPHSMKIDVISEPPALKVNDGK